MTQITRVALILVSVTALTACLASDAQPASSPAPMLLSSPAPAPPPPAANAPLELNLLEGGVVKFVNRDELPNTIFTHRGKLHVTLAGDYVVVTDIKTGEELAFPQRRLMYVGSVDFD